MVFKIFIGLPHFPKVEHDRSLRMQSSASVKWFTQMGGPRRRSMRSDRLP